MHTKQILNEWRSFLNESSKSKITVDLKGTKLSVYHLTGVSNMTKSDFVSSDSESDIIQQNPSTIDSNNRTYNILQNLKKGERERAEAGVNPKESIEFNSISSILSDPFTKGTGFNPGDGDMYGRGLYTCYSFNPQIAKVYGDICLKFEVDISNYIIFFEDLAKQIHGEDWRIEDQIKKVIKANFYNANIDNITLTSLQMLTDDYTNFGRRCTEKINGKSFLSHKDITSDVALSFYKHIGKIMPKLFDGIIFRGSRDGPVCVIFDPANDAKLTKIGRLKNVGVSKEVKVFWSNSLREFFGDVAKFTYDVDFQTMNDIADETHTDDSSNKIRLNTNDFKTLNVTCAKNHNTPPTILTNMVDVFINDPSANSRVLETLASNPNTSDESLLKLSKISQPVTIRAAVLTNPNTSADIKEKLKHDINSDPSINKLDLIELFNWKWDAGLDISSVEGYVSDLKEYTDRYNSTSTRHKINLCYNFLSHIIKQSREKVSDDAAFNVINNISDVIRVHDIPRNIIPDPICDLLKTLSNFNDSPQVLHAICKIPTHPAVLKNFIDMKHVSDETLLYLAQEVKDKKIKGLGLKDFTKAINKRLNVRGLKLEKLIRSYVKMILS